MTTSPSEPSGNLTGLVCLFLLLSALTSLSAAEKVADSAPVVPGYERVYNAPIALEDEEDEEDPQDITPRDRTHSGRVLLGELGCVKCHQTNDETTAQHFSNKPLY